MASTTGMATADAGAAVLAGMSMAAAATAARARTATAAAALLSVAARARATRPPTATTEHGGAGTRQERLPGLRKCRLMLTGLLLPQPHRVLLLGGHRQQLLRRHPLLEPTPTPLPRPPRGQTRCWVWCTPLSRAWLPLTATNGTASTPKLAVGWRGGGRSSCLQHLSP